MCGGSGGTVKTNKSMSHINKLSIIGTVFILTALGVFTYWSFQPDVITITDPLNIPVGKSVYKVGERITYTFEYCKTRKLVGVVDRALVDSYRITYAQITSDLAVGCYTVNVNDLVIPDFIVTNGDKYYLEITAVYKINPIKTQYVYLRTQEFLIQ